MPAIAEKISLPKHKNQRIESAHNAASVVPCNLPESLINFCRVLPLQEHNSFMSVAAAQNCSLKMLEELRFAVGKNVKVVYKEQEWIDREIKKSFPYLGTKPDVTNKEVTPASRKIVNDDTPTVELVNDIINRAIKLNASDIHVEPLEKELRFRYRLDGVLRTAPFFVN